MEGYPPQGGYPPPMGQQQQQQPYYGSPQGGQYPQQQQQYVSPQQQQHQQQYVSPQQSPPQNVQQNYNDDPQASLLDNARPPATASSASENRAEQQEAHHEANPDLFHDAKSETLMKREVVDHDKYDIDLLQDVKDMQKTKADWKFKIETLVATWVLFNAITTIMLVLTNMQKRVPRDVIETYGEEKFAIVMNAVTYLPLAFFGLLILLFNNYFAEQTFYMYLQRGALVDYPESSSVGYLFKNWRPLIFVFIALGYVGLTLFTMFKFKADVGTVLIWLNNMVIGVCMFWYRQQSIEYRFVSISNFIQAFPNRSNVYGDMDRMSLYHASKLMQKFVLTESREPSYTGYMRNFWWKSKNYTGVQKLMHHVGLVGLMVSLAGLAFAYFFVIGRFDVKSKWTAEISPCTAVCFQYYTAAVTDAVKCGDCICDCMRYLQYQDKHTLDACSDYMTFGHCKALCPTMPTCGFK